MTKIYKITSPDGQEHFYTSITAVLKHKKNPVNITNRYWSKLVAKYGYPFSLQGCKIEQVFALSGSDVRGRSEVENANVN